MDEAEQIVLSAMEQGGVVLPPGVMAVRDIGPAALISMCSQALALAGVDTDVYLPGLVPKSATERFRACTILVDQIKLLGYRDDLSFHQFFYPNKTDVHRLLRFLVQKLSKSSPGFSTTKGKNRRRRGVVPARQPEDDIQAAQEDSSRADEIVQLENRLKLLKQQLAEEETDFQLQNSLKLDKQIVEEIERTEVLEARLALLREAVNFIQGHTGSPIECLDVAIKECQKLLCSEQEERASAGEAMEREIQHLEQEKRQLNVDEGLQRELEELAAKIKKREEEQASLTLELEKLPKQASRSSYVHRISELVKNSKKQDADIAKIISETRELQRESNATQERLHRIHALVDELVFRDAKKDGMCRMAYRLLNNMHESFTDLTNKVFEMDKLERDVADLQVELEAMDMDKSHVSIAKVQADLDTVRAENMSLELAGRVGIASPLKL